MKQLPFVCLIFFSIMFIISGWWNTNFALMDIQWNKLFITISILGILIATLFEGAK